MCSFFFNRSPEALVSRLEAGASCHAVAEQFVISGRGVITLMQRLGDPLTVRRVHSTAMLWSRYGFGAEKSAKVPVRLFKQKKKKEFGSAHRTKFYPSRTGVAHSAATTTHKPVTC